MTANAVDFVLYGDVSFQGVQTEALVKAGSKIVILPVRNAMPDGFSSGPTCPDFKEDFEKDKKITQDPFASHSQQFPLLRNHSLKIKVLAGEQRVTRREIST